jgi:CHC2 zinc finger
MRQDTPLNPDRSVPRVGDTHKPEQHPETAITIEERYRQMKRNGSWQEERLADVQQRRLHRTFCEVPEADAGNRDPSILPVLVSNVVGPLKRRRNRDLEGPCPWHTSKSGRCLAVYRNGTRWYCRSCGRGGDAVKWLSMIDGITVQEARRRLDHLLVQDGDLIDNEVES